MRHVSLKREPFEELSSSVLGSGGVLRFRARGASMYPFLRNGDILTIRPVAPTTMEVGAVAFYRNQQNKLVAHRVIQVDRRDDQIWLKIRGDALPGPAEVVAGDQVLGQVVIVQRGKKTFHLDQGYRNRLDKLIAKGPPTGAWLHKAMELATRAVLPVLTRLQGLSIYRTFARYLIGRKICYRLATPRDAAALFEFSGFGGQSGEKIAVEDSGHPTETPQGFQYILVALLHDKVVGMVDVVRYPQDEKIYTGVWLWGMLVRTRYRGAGIGEGLIRLALEKAAEAGSSSLNLLVFKHNQAAMRLYQKMGFRPAANPALERELEKEEKAGMRRRIFLSHP